MRMSIVRRFLLLIGSVCCYIIFELIMMNFHCPGTITVDMFLLLLSKLFRACLKVCLH